MDWHSLPPELLEHISSFCDVPALQRLACCSRASLSTARPLLFLRQMQQLDAKLREYNRVAAANADVLRRVVRNYRIIHASILHGGLDFFLEMDDSDSDSDSD